ncbi:Protein Y55F3AM.11, partial [Aphelenchoides avenae]
GGKWVCNPEYLPTANCIVYAIGLNNEISFEEDFQNFTNNACALRAIDQGEQSPEILARLARINATPLQAFLAQQDNDTQRHFSFTSLMKHFGDSRIEVLKLDAEGAELLVFDQIAQVPICQFLFEGHASNVFEMFQFLEKVSKAGFYLFFSEVNAFHPDHLREYAFIHKSCLEKYHVDVVY